jgi:hypothetical protein
MRSSVLYSLTVILVAFISVGVEASQPGDSALTEREAAAMQAKISRLETELKDARQTISSLETELETARNEFAEIQQAPATDAGEPASAVSAADSGDVIVTAVQLRPGVPAAITQLSVRRQQCRQRSAGSKQS